MVAEAPGKPEATALELAALAGAGEAVCLPAGGDAAWRRALPGERDVRVAA